MDGPLPRFALRRLPVACEGLAPGLLDTVIGWGRYQDGVRCIEPRFDTALELARSGRGFFWVEVHAPNTRQVGQLGEIFGLHPVAIENVGNLKQRPMLKRYDDVLFLSMRTLDYVEREARDEGGDVVETGWVMVLIGEHFAVTVRHGRHSSISSRRRALEVDPDHLVLGPAAVLHAVIDKVVDDYLAVVDAVNEDIEEIETDIFANRASSAIERIYELKRDVIEMKRTVGALAGPVRTLAERPDRLVSSPIREYFRDVGDHLDRVREHVASFDELLSSILQAGLARLSVSENEDMRKIAAWAMIAAVMTVIAGIYGMNFRYMPELSQVWGYPLVLTGMGVIAAALYGGFKRNGWL